MMMNYFQINDQFQINRFKTILMGTPKMTLMNNTGGIEGDNFDIIL